VEIAQAALAATHEQEALAVGGEVGDQLAVIRVAHDGAHRHAQHHVLAGAAVAVGAHAALAVVGPVHAREVIVDQRIDVAVGARPHAAAAPAVAAVGPALGHVPFAAKARRAVASLAGMHLDLRFVDEFHGPGKEKALSRIDRALVVARDWLTPALR